MDDSRKATMVLIMNTLAFTVCFAVWMMNGVLITFLVDMGVYAWDKAQMGWLIGIPVLSGSIMRLPAGVLTDRYGGRIVYTLLMLCAAVTTYLTSLADTFPEFLLASLGFGLSGASFAIGIAYTSVWFPKERQGTALGIFGMGNAGSALTSLFAPSLLLYFTDNGANLDAWRRLPQVYALALLVMAVVFYFLTHPRRVAGAETKTLAERLTPLKFARVWRFGLYYFLVFGGFVALAQWLIPYYVNVYAMSVAAAGLMASVFSLPSGVIRALGGWLSDKFGARPVMYWVLGACILCCGLLAIPRMEIQSPGEGLMAARPGVVTEVTAEHVVAGGVAYPYRNKETVTSYRSIEDVESGALVMPQSTFWQEPAVAVGDQVVKRQLVVRGVTHIFFQANVWIFTALVFIIGIMMGIGKAAVYKYIPEYFPKDVGVVGGIVGVVGGLGGFVCPVIFGYFLRETGIWTTTWIFLFWVSVACLVWLHIVARRLIRTESPALLHKMEHEFDAGFAPIGQER
jgi:NNP family nitrate/nitrite transporter-like MFS transporter